MEMLAINTNKCLPQELTVQSVEDILHRISLTLDSNKAYSKRKLFFNPIIIFIFFSLIIIREVPHILNVGIFRTFIGIKKTHFDHIQPFGFSGFKFQLVHYNNYRNGIKPTFLRVFQMMSGLFLPKSLGLTDEPKCNYALDCRHYHDYYIFNQDKFI